MTWLPFPYRRPLFMVKPFKKGERVIALNEISDSEKVYAQQGDLGIIVHLGALSQIPTVKFDGHLTGISVGWRELAPAPN